MKTIKRILENLKWAIFNHPPTNFTQTPVTRNCDYCGSDSNWFHSENSGMTICYACVKKIADKVLLEKKKKPKG